MVRKPTDVLHRPGRPRQLLTGYPKDEAGEVARPLAESVFPAMLLFILVDDLILGAAFCHAVGKRHHGPLDQCATEARRVCARTIVVEPPLRFDIVSSRELLANPLLNGRVKVVNRALVGRPLGQAR